MHKIYVFKYSSYTYQQTKLCSLELRGRNSFILYLLWNIECAATCSYHEKSNLVYAERQPWVTARQWEFNFQLIQLPRQVI